MILNTRPSVYRDRVHSAFADCGWPIVDCPLLSPEATGAALPAPDQFDAVIFTSALGVRFFPSDAKWRSKKAYVVGPGTAEAAKAGGFNDVVRTGFNADTMRDALTNADFRNALYASGEEVTTDLGRDIHGRVRRVVLYRMIPLGDLPGEIVAAAKDCTHMIAPIFSKRSARVLNDLFFRAGLTQKQIHMTAVGISEDVLVEQGPWKARAVASEPTLVAIAAAAREIIRKAHS